MNCIPFVEEEMASVSTSASPPATPGEASGSTFAMNIWSNMKDLDDFDYDNWIKWKLEVQLILSIRDMDLALLEDEPPVPTETSSQEDRIKYEKWKRCNRSSLLLMKSKMSSYIHGFVPDSDNARQYLAGIENLVMKFEEARASILITQLTNMKYDGEGNVSDHIFKMCNIARRLGAVGRVVDDYQLLCYVIFSLPPHFHYISKNALGGQWKLSEVASKCAFWEEYIRQHNMDSEVISQEGLNDVRGMNDFEGNGDSNHDNMRPQGKRAKKRNDLECYHCGMKGHLRRDCRMLQ